MLVEKELTNEGGFTDPIKDIFKTASYGAKKVGATIGTNALKLLGQTFATLLPFVSHKEVTNIGNRANKKKEELISKLDSQYKDVLERNREAFLNQDIAAVTALLNPGLYLTAKAGLSGTAAALGALELIVSPFEALRNKVSGLKNKVETANQTKQGWPGHGKSDLSGGGGGMGGDFGDYGGMYENQQPPQSIDAEIKALLSDPQVVNAVKNSDLVKQLDRAYLQSVEERTTSLDKIHSMNDLKVFMGPEDYNATSKQINNERVSEKEIIDQMKLLYKQVYVDLLNKNKEKSSIPNEVDALIKKLS